MHLLILGGTRFVGRHLVDAALSAGHRVTLFNRGQTNPELFSEAEKLRGDREGDLSALLNRRFDAVIDVAGYVPRVVGRSARMLERQVDSYVFISSISVYASLDSPGVNEESPVAVLEDESSEEVNEHYGALKALCEIEVQKTYGDRSLVIRPGLIVGPFDPTNRFTYWVRRVAQSGRLIAPGPPDRQVQYIDARDLAEWTVRLVEEGVGGVFNATGPVPPVSFAAVLGSCREAAGQDIDIVWVDDRFLQQQGIESWTEMPMWVPADDVVFAALMEVDVSRAVGAGLTFRSPTQSAAAVLEWIRSIDDPPGLAGLAPEREIALLEAVEFGREGGI